MTLTARLLSFPNGSGIVAVGFLEGHKTVVLISVNETPWSALQGVFVQAKWIADAIATPKYAPLTTINLN
ncbi:hypothetical protein LCGC14_1227170 [marine sediment metagenome]|uniref:Uncharacterized protein n=1 Tax=marine sediment metagenome TaxID=412755 RepID=A0A0F9L9I7_9ZZZZ